mgnify:FL=1
MDDLADIGDDIHPLSSHYGWVVKDKEHFGREGLRQTPTQKLIGLKLEKVPVREGYPVKVGGQVVGHVTSGTTSPTLGHPIAVALVDAASADADAFEVEVRGKDHPAQRAEIPFYTQKA